MVEEVKIHPKRDGESFCIDAEILGALLQVPAHEVQKLMRARKITSRCERGEGEHKGRHRLTFRYNSRCVRIDVDDSGQILKRSIVDLSELT